MMLFKSLEVVKLVDVKREYAQFILKDIMPIPTQTVNMLSSAGGMGKTFVSIRLANEFVKETGSRVLCWFSEDGDAEVGLRYDAMIKSGMISQDCQDKILLVKTEPIQFAVKEKGIFVANYHALDELKKDCIVNDIKFLIVDPLLAFYGGDENDNSQARIFMQPFIEWTKQYDITILFIHHSSKSGGGTRGAGAFRDAVRTLYEMRYIEDKKGNTDYEKKDYGMRELSLVKDNRNAYYWFNKKYGGGVAEVQILPNLKKQPIVYEYTEKMEMTYV